jgi:hypothetical protein
MVRHASLFSQLVALFNRQRFHELVYRHRSERYAKGYLSWEHFVAMLFCQLAQAKSLREISGGLASCLGKLRHLGVKSAPNKSTLSYANAHRPWQLFQDLFYQTLQFCQQAAPGKAKRFRFKNKLLSLDSTTIPLCLTLFPWARFRTTKGAVKLHMLLDHDGYLPSFACITDGKRHDISVARGMSLAKGSIVVVDRGYTDFELFGRWTENGIFFVTRQKDNADYIVVQRQGVPVNRNILSDELIELTGLKSHAQCPHVLRRVVMCDTDSGEVLVFLTNHLQLGPTSICAIYKDRWQIETFFKALKQNLKIKTFVGTSENALFIQIWTALIAMLLIKFLQFKSRFRWSLSNLVAFLRWNLFTYRNLWDWIDSPFETIPIMPGPVQHPLPFSGFGQQPQIKVRT